MVMEKPSTRLTSRISGRLISSGAVRRDMALPYHMEKRSRGRASSKAMRPSRIMASMSRRPDQGIMR